MGLLAGDRPTADVDVLAGAFAVVEYELARRMHAASSAGSLPLVGPGAVLARPGVGRPACPTTGPRRGSGRRAPVAGGGVGGGDHHQSIMWMRSPATSAR